MAFLLTDHLQATFGLSDSTTDTLCTLANELAGSFVKILTRGLEPTSADVEGHVCEYFGRRKLPHGK